MYGSHRGSRRPLIARLAWCGLAILTGWLFGPPRGLGADPRNGAGGDRVAYMIVVTGGELLAGAYADGHTFFLTRTLAPLGLRCIGSMSVDDKAEDLKAALRFATARARLVIVTGGLGPTDNDITRQTLSEFTGVALAEDPDVLEKLERRFHVPRDRLRANLRIQTRVPVGGTYLKNPHGTAVGLVFEQADTVIVALPGPPRELQPMVLDELLPFLSRRFGTHMPGCSLTVRFVGIGQSGIDQTLEEHVPLPADVADSSQFEDGRVDFTFTLPGDTPEDRARLEKLRDRIVEYLGEYIYAVDGQTTLEERVLRMLSDRGQTLAVVDVGSGGRLASGLAGAPGAEQAFAGAYVASTDEKVRRLLAMPEEAWRAAGTDGERARLLATAAADRTGSSWAIVVGQAEGSAKDAGHVEIVLHSPDGGWESRQVPAPRADPAARFRLATQVLDQLRRKLN